MKKLLLTLGIVILLLSCKNDSMEDEKKTNPYPDGVYPFEVSGINQTKDINNNYSVTWTMPDGATSVNLEMFIILGDGFQTEAKEYSSLNPSDYDGYHDFVLKKNSFSFHYNPINDKFVIIKCVDKFGNVSNGVKYDFPNP
jgi:hypothetical protein